MKDTPGLYDTLVQVLRQHEKCLDVRHAKTLAWMMVGLIESGLIGLTAWTPYVQGRAIYAQSTVRRFRRWLDNRKIEVHDLYGPLISRRWLSGAHIGCIWRSTPRCSGINTALYAFRSSFADAPCRLFGRCWRMAAAL